LEAEPAGEGRPWGPSRILGLPNQRRPWPSGRWV